MHKPIMKLNCSSPCWWYRRHYHDKYYHYYAFKMSISKSCIFKMVQY